MRRLLGALFPLLALAIFLGGLAYYGERLDKNAAWVDALGAMPESRLTGRAFEFIADIAVQAVDQTSTLKQVNLALTEMDQATQLNAAMAEEATAACQSLSQECLRLMLMAQKFRLDPASGRSEPVSDPATNSWSAA